MIDEDWWTGDHLRLFGVFGDRRRDPNALSIGLKLGAAAVLAPFMTTIAPAEVIHDPAVILVTVALLTAATEALGWGVQGAENDLGPAASQRVRRSGAENRAEAQVSIG